MTAEGRRQMMAELERLDAIVADARSRALLPQRVRRVPLRGRAGRPGDSRWRCDRAAIALRSRCDRAAIALLALAALAALVPAVRATRVEPIRILRSD